MRQYNPKIHHRKSIRLKGYDYGQEGLYFVTICTQNRACLFGEIALQDEQPQETHIENNVVGMPLVGIPLYTGDIANMVLNDAGKMIEKEWMHLKNRFCTIELHEFVIMPNHFHGILEIMGQPQGIAPTNKTIGTIIGAFKSITTHHYINGVKTLGWNTFDSKLWQRNYWEHIIRNENDYTRIATYIINNPQEWKIDSLHRNSNPSN